MCQSVGDHECSAWGVKVAIIEGEQVLRAILQALKRVRHRLGEVPEIALVGRLERVASILVDGRHSDVAGEHVTPLSYAVPVQLGKEVIHAKCLRFSSRSEHSSRRRLLTASRYAPGARRCSAVAISLL